MTRQRVSYLTKYLTKERAVAGPAVISSPVGAIVGTDGPSFAIEPLDLDAMPVRIRCTWCPWQASAPNLAAGAAQAARHTTAHQLGTGGAA